MMGEGALRDWTAEQTMAWEGLLELGRALRREAEVRIEERHGLSGSMLGIMGRLMQAPERTLRQSALAGAMGLSVSRVSRIVDLLEGRGNVTRHQCPLDARATNVRLTDAGRTRAVAAQTTIHAYAREAFVDRLSPEETAVLAGVFTRLIEGAGRAGDPAGA
jgi:DNA-binding MarR family transcriptional regulator